MSRSSISLDAAQLLALYMQSILYGIVLITVAYGLRVLIWHRDGRLKSRARINWIMVGVTLAMFTIATLEVAIGFRHNLDAFIYYTGPGGPTGEFSEISNWVNVMAAGTYIVQTFIGDAIMAYRCYVIYNRNWKVVVVPVLLWLAEAVCGFFVLYLTATLQAPATENEARLVPWTLSGLVVTLVMTTMTTGMIIYRILKVHGGLAAHNVTHLGGNDSIPRVVRVLIESGLMYTVAVVIFVCTYLANNNAEHVLSDVIVQLIPISFTLIIIRVDQHMSDQSSSVQQSMALAIPVRAGLPGRAGPDASQGTVASRSNFPGRQGDVYMLEDMGSDRDGWKPSSLDPEA